MHVHSYVMHLLCILQCSLLQDTAVYTYTQTHLHDLLVAKSRARILMQKHIFSMWAESKDASKSEEFSMKGVSMQKL